MRTTGKFSAVAKNFLSKNKDGGKLGKGFRPAAVKDYLKAHPSTVVHYVRNEHGFVKGVVVGTGKDNIGWSLVHSDLDTTTDYVNLRSTPAFQLAQTKLRRAADALDLIDNEDARRLFRSSILGASEMNQGLGESGVVVQVPIFDKANGLYQALNRALDNPVKFIPDPLAVGVSYIEDTPNDPEMTEAIFSVKDRLAKIYKD